MKALLLAAGLGMRLRPLTLHTPKCLLPIHGEPLLAIWLRSLEQLKVDRVIINTHYLSEVVSQFLSKQSFNIPISVVNEPELLGTARTVVVNRHLFAQDDLLLIHADNYCRLDLEELKKAHFERPAGCLMTMLTFTTEEPETCGIVKVDDRGVVTEFVEKPVVPDSNLANAAIYIISEELIKEMELIDGLVDFSRDVIPSFIGKIYTHYSNVPVIDIGAHDRYAKLSHNI